MCGFSIHPSQEKDKTITARRASSAAHCCQMEPSLLSADHLHLRIQFWWSLFILIPMVLIAHTVVAGTRYSPILIIVIFGLLMGFVLVSLGVSTAGLPDFPLLNILSRTTIVALAATLSSLVTSWSS